MSFSNFDIFVVIDLSFMKLCSAKRSCDEKIKGAFNSWSLRWSWNPEARSRFMGNRIRCRDEDSGVEAEIRKAVCGRNFVRLSLLRSLRQRVIWGAKLRRVSVVSISGSTNIAFWRVWSNDLRHSHTSLRCESGGAKHSSYETTQAATKVSWRILEDISLERKFNSAASQPKPLSQPHPLASFSIT